MLRRLAKRALRALAEEVLAHTAPPAPTAPHVDPPAEKPPRKPKGPAFLSESEDMRLWLLEQQSLPEGLRDPDYFEVTGGTKLGKEIRDAHTDRRATWEMS